MERKVQRNRRWSTKGFAHRSRKDKIMVQVAAALLFALAAGLGVTVILAMLKNNENAILSALLGEGAFPAETAPHSGPLPQKMTLRRSPARRDAPRPIRAAARMQPALSRAA
jgi:hypothetical protein